MADPIQILLADDHPVVRVGLRFSIEEDATLGVVAEAGDGEEALSLIQDLQPDIAVLDIEMPKLDGLCVARKMMELHLKTRIIFLTLHKDEDYFRAAMEAGGKGYLLKDSASQEIVTGIREISEGRLYVSPAMATHLLKRKPVPASPVTESLNAQLTPAERRILNLIAEGQSSKEIGEKLSIHYRTVENHRTNMCRKFGIEGANALLRFALQNKATF